MFSLLTDKDVGGERGREAEDDDEDVGERQVDDEVVGDRPHSGRAEDDGDDEAVADEADGEDDQVGDAVDGRHGRRVAVHELGPRGVRLVRRRRRRSRRHVAPRLQLLQRHLGGRFGDACFPARGFRPTDSLTHSRASQTRPGGARGEIIYYFSAPRCRCAAASFYFLPHLPAQLENSQRTHSQKLFSFSRSARCKSTLMFVFCTGKTASFQGSPKPKFFLKKNFRLFFSRFCLNGFTIFCLIYFIYLF